MFNANEQIVYNTLIGEGFSKESAAAIMGVVGGESAFLTLKETSYRNTDNERIRNIFPSRLGNASDSYLNQLKQSDYDFFNAVYGGLYGNAANEGYKYVGRGFNGITFKSNYQNAKNKTGIDFVNSPELMENPTYAAKALASYFDNMKNYDDLELAFQKAYVNNAGPAYPFSYYQASWNPVHQTGIPLKRSKAQYYYSMMDGGGGTGNYSSGIVTQNSILLAPIIAVISLAMFFLYKKRKK